MSQDQAASVRWCVFTSAGDYHNISFWGAANPKKNWDFVVCFYGDNETKFEQLKSFSNLAVRMKGSKFQNLKRLFSTNPEFLQKYDFIFVTDDDMLVTSAQIDRLFQIAEAYDFWVCHPAFSDRGRISHPLTARSASHIRITNFVELTCPVFRTDKLTEFLSVYDGELTGWGIDWWYGNYFKANEIRKFAIIDEIEVINPLDHQRPGGVREIEKLQPDAAREKHWRIKADKFGLKEYEIRNLAFIVEPSRDEHADNVQHDDKEDDKQFLRAILNDHQHIAHELQLARTECLRLQWDLRKNLDERQQLEMQMQRLRQTISRFRTNVHNLRASRYWRVARSLCGFIETKKLQFRRRL